MHGIAQEMRRIARLRLMWGRSFYTRAFGGSILAGILLYNGFGWREEWLKGSSLGPSAHVLLSDNRQAAATRILP